MLVLGIVLVLLALAAHTIGSQLSSSDNEGQELPTVWGNHPVRPALRIRWLHNAGWLLSIVGALLIGDVLWNSHPGASIVIVVVVIVLVNALPSLIVTLLHNRRVAG